MARNDFLSKFEKLSVDFSSKIAVYYISKDSFSSIGISYLNLNRVSSELSEYFSKIFKTNRQYIGVRLTDRLWISCLLLGIWKSGNAFAGIACHFSKQENLKFMKRLKIKYIITDVDDNDFDASLVCNFKINDQKFFVWQMHEANSQFLQWDMCFGIMTSGSTAIPKIVQVPWSCILPNAQELCDLFEITSFDNIYQSAPYTFDPFFIDIFLGFITGASITFASKHIKFSYDNLLHILFLDTNENFLHTNKSFERNETDSLFNCDIKSVKPEKITILQSTPSLFLNWGKKYIEEILSNSKLRLLFLGGEKFPSSLSNYRTAVKIFNIYGITEISCWAFIKDVQLKTLKVSIGKPLKDIIYKIVEEELYIGSKVRKCLVDEEEYFYEDEIVYRATGDIVKIVNDELYHAHRTNLIVKKFGIKVDLNKIENIFLDLLNVSECCCVFEDSRLKLVLFLVFNPPRNLEKDYLVLKPDENLRRTISQLSDIEKPDVLIEISALPINNNGKCDRQKLLKIARSLPSKECFGENLTNIFCGIWRDVLNLKEIDPSKSFVELGGNSVLALQMTMKLNDAGVKTPKNFLRDLLNNENFDNCLKSLTKKENHLECLPKKLKRENELNLSILWKMDLQKCIDAPPSIAKVKGSDKVFVGSHSSLLASINIDSGVENWQIKLGDRIESGCCIHENKSLGIVGCYDHFVYCISLTNGIVNWNFKTGDMIKSTPCLSTDQESVFVASYDTYLYHLAVKDGILLQKIKISNKGIYSTGIVLDTLDSFYISALDGSCVSINQSNSNIAWKSQLNSPIFASPCLVKKTNQIEVLFIEVLGRVHAFSADAGIKLWCYESDGNVYSSPTFLNANNQNYILYGCHDQNLYCLQIDSKPILKYKLPLDSAIFATPQIFRIANEELIAAVSTKGIVYIINFNSGLILSSLQLNGEIFSTPRFHDKRLLVGCRDNYLYCLQLEKI